MIFQQAYLHLGIPILIESKHFIQTCWLEERCVMTIVATWYRYLTNSHNIKLSLERISKVIQHSLIINHKIFNYIKQVKRWFKWSNINMKQMNQLLCKIQESNEIRNQLDIKEELQNLLIWRQNEKAEKMSELVQLETLLTEIHTNQLAESRRLFKPPNGYNLSDLEESWQCLITAEHNCHLAIVDELIRRDQNDSIKPIEFLKEELTENFNQISIQTHHSQSRLHLLMNELQLKYGINYYNQHYYFIPNQTLYNKLQQIITHLNSMNFNQLTMNDISLMSIIQNIHLNESKTNETQEYDEYEIIGNLEKCPLIRIYEDIITVLSNMHLSNFSFDHSTSISCQTIQHEERSIKVIEFIQLLQRQWNKLLIGIKEIHINLIRHKKYLNELYSLITLNTKIEEINLRIYETYQSVLSISMLADSFEDLIEPVKDKSIQNEVIDTNNEGKQSSIIDKKVITNILGKQKALTIDKEIVINSILRQMDHIIEQLKLYTTYLNQLQNEVYIFLPSRSILNDNDYTEFLHLETKLNNLSVSRKSCIELTVQSDKQQQHEDSDHSDEISLTGLQTVGSSFQEDIDSIISKSIIDEDTKEQIDQNQLPGIIQLNETLNLQQTNCEIDLVTNESENNLQRLLFTSIKSITSNNIEDNENDQYTEEHYRTPMNSPEEHELSILLLPNISIIAYHLLNRLNFIQMHYIDYLKDSLNIRDKLEFQRNILRLIDNIVSMENWIKEKERILLTFNPIIYPSVEFLKSLPTSCPIIITEEIIHSISQLSIQAYRFKTFEHELISHANLRLSEIEVQEEEDSNEVKDKLDEITIDKGSDQEFIETDHADKASYLRTSKGVNNEQTDDNNVYTSKYSKLLDYINKKWQHLKLLINSHHDRFELAASLSKFHTLCQTTNEWIIHKRELLISTDDLGTDLNSVMQLQRRLLGWEKDFIALQNEIQNLNIESERLLKALIEEAPKRRDLYLISGELYATKEVNQLRLNLNHEWELLQVELRNRHDKLLASAELQQFFQGLDDNQLWLHNIEIRVATHQLAQSVEEAKLEIDIHNELIEQILTRKDEYNDLINYGRCITAGETDLHYIQLDQRLDRLENGWIELMQMWTYQQKVLQQNLNFQIFLRDAHSFETLLSTQESKLMNYQLITLQYTTLLDEARTLVDSTKDLIALREDMQQIQTLQEWLIEKKELAEEYDQASKLSNMSSLVPYKVFVSKQYTQHRILESEIEANNDRIQQVCQHVTNTIVQYPRIADQLSELLNNFMLLWKSLRKLIQERGDYMVQLHRGMLTSLSLVA
ncbi:putative spectrin beta chain [Schistosoma mansoni]|uniref:putative spectrin beta chain n=1 Tax=Schistosoma mansoni TaxID=6183 RepID=UPI00022DC37F|nr:putative spectrin beta chain [Schistosoma mansoni]|eukprot:XP_018652092.1 putative spectrin beta chain [Schistosoma mansoni]